MAALLSLATFALGCDDASTEPNIIAGVDLDALFAPPSAAEIDAVLADWATRAPTAQGVVVEVTDTIRIVDIDARLLVVSHLVDGARHYGGILVPEGKSPSSLPLLVIGHGGDQGIALDDLLLLLPFALGDSKDDFVYAVPSFRSEPLSYKGVTYLSEGQPSPWDRDVDDALALVNVAFDLAPEASSVRIGVVGFSRGAGVALLMAERDPRIDRVVEFFGPTDFFGPFVREVTEEALRDELRDLPGLDFLNENYLQPLKAGGLTIADVRSQMVRRSAVYFADRLPELQIHHGTLDTTVPVGEAERLIEVMGSLGRGPPGFESYIYVGGGHDPLTLPSSLQRTREFVERALTPQPAGGRFLPP